MLTFEQALTHIKNGIYMQRSGWNGKGMYLFLVSDWTVHSKVKPENNLQPHIQSPWICMRTADFHLVPWLASQTDLLANDWQTATNV